MAILLLFSMVITRIKGGVGTVRKSSTPQRPWWSVSLETDETQTQNSNVNLSSFLKQPIEESLTRPLTFTLYWIPCHFFLSCLWNSLMSYKQKKKVSWTTHVHLRIKIWNDKIMMAHSKSLRREEARDCVRDTFVVWCQVGWPLRDSGHSFLIC